MYSKIFLCHTNVRLLLISILAALALTQNSLLLNAELSEPILVINLNTLTQSSDAEKLTNVNGTLFFTADDGVHNDELWKSDGTAERTQLAKDFNPGEEGGEPDGFAAFEDTIFFSAYDGFHGRELWAMGISGSTIYMPVVPVESWYVIPDGDDDDSCRSPETSCATINGVLNKPDFMVSDTILVASGTYTGTGSEVVLLDKDVTVLGGWDADFTTQSGTSTVEGEESRRGIAVIGAIVAIDRFTVQSGYTDGSGGGIYNSGTMTLTNSTIRSNTAGDEGGGVHGTDNSLTTLISAQIYGNTATNGEGGGIEVENNSHIRVLQSWVVGNAALNNDAGGINIDHDSSSYIENSFIAGNTSADSAGGLGFGGSGPHRIVNSHIVGNYTSGEGAAVAAIFTQVELTNTLIISNTGNSGIDDKYGSGSVFRLSHCDTYGNSPDGTAGLTIIRSNCLGLPPEDGVDPILLGGALPVGVGPPFAEQWLAYDYHLQINSPAIDAADNFDAPIIDFENDPRPLDGNGDGVLSADIGADEFSLTPTSLDEELEPEEIQNDFFIFLPMMSQ